MMIKSETPRKKTKRVVRLYYAFQFSFALLLWVPIFYDFERQIGLSDKDIFAIQSFYYFAFCFLEIPTGLIADYLGRLRCIRAGAVIVTLANLIPVFFQSFSGMITHFLLVALARSLISGASSAYLYDYLANNGGLPLYRKAEGNARALSLAGKVVLWAGVGFLMKWHLSLPYLLSAVGTGISILVALWFPALSNSADDGKERVSIRGARLFVLQLKPALALLPRSPYLILVMIQGVAIFVLSRVVQVDLFQPLLKTKGFGVGAFGLVMAGISVFEALGAAHPDWLRRSMGRGGISDLNSVFILTMILALCMAFISSAGAIGAIIGLCILSWVTGLAYPIQRQLMNQAIPGSQFRSTFLSIESIIDRAGSALMALMLGGIVARGEIGVFLHYSAGGALVLMLLLLIAMLWIRLPGIE